MTDADLRTGHSEVSGAQFQKSPVSLAFHRRGIDINNQALVRGNYSGLAGVWLHRNAHFHGLIIAYPAGPGKTFFFPSAVKKG